MRSFTSACARALAALRQPRVPHYLALVTLDLLPPPWRHVSTSLQATADAAADYCCLSRQERRVLLSRGCYYKPGLRIDVVHCRCAGPSRHAAIG